MKGKVDTVKSLDKSDSFVQSVTSRVLYWTMEDKVTEVRKILEKDLK